MIHIFKKHWPLIIGIGVLWITITILLILSVSQNQGHLIYALDDPYIHMAMAKNFVQHGVWGVDQYNFSSASSSPLWTLLLALTFFLFGANTISPFILNFIFGTLIIFGTYLLLRKYSLRPLFILISLLAIIFFAPLPSLIFCGLEHTMHAVLTIFFVYLSAKILADEKPASKEYILLLMLAPLITTARYEGLFLIFVVCALFAVRKRLIYSFLLGGLAIIPIAIYGVISIMNGWHFLPNSILLKGSIPLLSIIEMGKFFYRFGAQIVGTSHIFVLLYATLLLFILQIYKQRIFWKNSAILLTIFIATTLLHLLFAKTGWFFRYEAYLVALGIFVFTIGIHEYLPKKLSITFNKIYIALALSILIIILPLAIRGVESLIKTPQATTNIYEQQYQMSLFLNQFYQGERIAANDIGAINYFADIENLDLWGLSSLEVAKTKMDGSYTTQRIYDLAKQKEIKIAIVYDYWFKEYGGIPPEWIKVGEWKISNNVVCGVNIVSFYAVDPLETENLIKNLRTFSSHLPKDVVQTGRYTLYKLDDLLK